MKIVYVLALALAALMLGAASNKAVAATVPAANVQTQLDQCLMMPSYGPIQGKIVHVSAFGAIPDDGRNDQDALQRALDALAPGDLLWFDKPGVYEHNTVLLVRRSNIIVDGNGTAVLRGTNPQSQAVWIQSSNVEVRGLRINNASNERRHAPWQTGIAVYSRDSGATALSGIRILNNRLYGDGHLGTPTQNATSSAGIFLYNTHNFVVQGNVVERTLADGIHITGGSGDGRILSNTVRENGDDGIAVVSYADPSWRDFARRDPAAMFAMQRRELVRNILAYGNNVSAQYWGRGMSVVGGRDITFYKNSITKVVRFAGIYIAREPSYETLGARNILIAENGLGDIGNNANYFVPYLPNVPGFDEQMHAPPNSWHGGIEIYRALDAADRALPNAEAVFAMRNVTLRDNVVGNSRWHGIRVGVSGSRMQDIQLLNNQVHEAGRSIGQALGYQLISEAFATSPICNGNQNAGLPWSGSSCDVAPAAPSTGFSCKAGQL